MLTTFHVLVWIILVIFILVVLALAAIMFLKLANIIMVEVQRTRNGWSDR